MRPAALLAIGLLAASGACGESSGNRPGVLDGIQPVDASRPTGSSSGTVGGSSGSGSSSGGVSSCQTQMNGCTSLQLCGPQVDFNEVSGTMPTAQGGTIVPGTYELTKVDLYNGMGTGWERQTMRLTVSVDGGSGSDIDGGQSFTWESIAITDSSPLTTVSGTMFNLDATDVTFASGCPSNGSFPSGYTATATTLTLFVAGSSTNPGEVLTYTKQ